MPPSIKEIMATPGFDDLSPEAKNIVLSDASDAPSEATRNFLAVGFSEVLSSELRQGMGKIASGLSGEGAESIIKGKGLEKPATSLVEGILQTINAPIAATGEAVGEPVRKGLEPLGPTVSAVGGAGANAITQLISSALTGNIAGRGINLARSKIVPGIAKRLPGANVALRTAGQETVEAIPKGLLPQQASEGLFRQLETMNPVVKLPKLQSTAKEISAIEAELGEFGLSNAGVKSTMSDMGTNLASQRRHIDDFGSQLETVTELKDVPFNVVQSIRRRIGQRIHSLRNSTDPKAAEQLGAYKKAFRNLSEDLDNAAEAGAGEAFQILKRANTAAKREFAVEELDEIIKNNIGKALEGTQLESTNFAKTLNQIRKTRGENELFEKGLGTSNLDAIEKTLDQLRQIKLPPPPKGANVGSFQALTRLGQTGAIGELAGRAVGLPPWIGGMGAVATRETASKIISTALQHPRGRQILLNMVKTPGGINPNSVAALMVLARGATGINLPPPEQHNQQ